MSLVLPQESFGYATLFVGRLFLKGSGIGIDQPCCHFKLLSEYSSVNLFMAWFAKSPFWRGTNSSCCCSYALGIIFNAFFFLVRRLARVLQSIEIFVESNRSSMVEARIIIAQVWYSNKRKYFWSNDSWFDRGSNKEPVEVSQSFALGVGRLRSWWYPGFGQFWSWWFFWHHLLCMYAYVVEK